MSERVALRLVLHGVVVTWFVTGSSDFGKADGAHAMPLEPILPQRSTATYPSRKTVIHQHIWRSNFRVSRATLTTPMLSTRF